MTTPIQPIIRHSELPVPENCSYRDGDWHLLASFWYPIALSSEVTKEEPKSALLLDVPLVLYRSESGVTVAYDRCPHRGARLSKGRMENGNLSCPYHAFSFDGSGHCTLVPAHGPDFRIPSRFCLKVFQVQEKYGLVWTCLKDEARQPLPAHDKFDNPPDGYKIFQLEHAVWNASVMRHAENFNDLAHIHIVHDRSFGDRDFPLVPDYKVEDTEEGFRRDVTMPARSRADFEDPEEPAVPCSFSYRFTFPFTSILVIKPQGGEAEETVMDAISPISATQSNIFMVKGRNYKLEDEHLMNLLDYQYATNEEDRAIVEQQSPQRVPLNPKAELHIPADKWSSHFRRRWREFGLENLAP